MVLQVPYENRIDLNARDVREMLSNVVYKNPPPERELEQQQFWKMAEAKWKLFVNRKALTCDRLKWLSEWPNAKVVDVDPSVVGVVTSRRSLPKWKQEYKTATRYLSETTANTREAQFYICRKETVFCTFSPTSGRQVLADGTRAAFPSKVATRSTNVT